MLAQVLWPEGGGVEVLVAVLSGIHGMNGPNLYRKIKPDIGQTGIVSFRKRDRQTRRRPRNPREAPATGNGAGHRAKRAGKWDVVVIADDKIVFDVPRRQRPSLTREERIQIRTGSGSGVINRFCV